MSDDALIRSLRDNLEAIRDGLEDEANHAPASGFDRERLLCLSRELTAQCEVVAAVLDRPAPPQEEEEKA